MTSAYQTWLQKEEEWIGAYCRRTRKNSLWKVAPLTLLLSVVVFGGIAFLGEGSVGGLLAGAARGLLIGLVLCAFYLAVLWIGLRPARYVRKIEQSVREAGVGEGEQERLGQEMLNALEQEQQVVSYAVWGPNGKGTPARVFITPSYLFQEGSTPYAVLVRRSDVAEVRMDSEQRMATTHTGSRKTYHNFTLYTIGFYRRDRFERGLTEKDLPDSAMGFFQKELRDEVVQRMQEAGLRVTTPEG